ncbi:proteasome activator complex subunit 4B-like isoform X1 [Vespula pensylvanica]|uniref:Proteasome activator complex subunit 4 n=1 Tax=Vespula pensylvanica TaxID=30213 RepID=A0A834MYY2_VESPE|nr:proteasome activator complex subunit 4B-like isoform X1 [Vespula pensylvanica]KAF7389675.1 hypothetical protein H0235_018159 [Vespula pensylvanica]
MNSDTNITNHKYQKELIYNKLLPYAKDLENESQVLLSEIKGNLGRAIMYREMQPGCSFWTTRLCKYIKIYGMKFSKEDHIYFIKLMYELIIIPNLDPFLINKFGSTLILLLKKKELLSPNDLELPWRPLYELNQRVRMSAESSIGMFRYFPFLGCTLNSLIHSAKIYFPLNATQEILDELRPMICPFDVVTMSNTFKTLEYFLPVHLSPEYHSFGHELWFNEFMTLWEVCHNGPQWENEIMWLMAKLAFANIGYINWEPYIPLMFTRFVRCLNLPVSYKQTQSIKSHKIEMLPIAIWIVSVLGNKSSAQMYLEKFLKTIETYFHAANIGRWSGKLKELLTKLPYRFILRVHKERYAKPTWETPIPDEYKLSDEDINIFVKSMMPVAMTAMFSKLSANDTCHALQHLATMRPSLVIPQVLERMYSTLDSLTEPHKLTAAMICMVAVARPMVQGSRNINKGYTYPEGPMHVLPLLFSSLPGIDPNDIGKCFVTFRLISVYAIMIPIVDSSRSPAIADEEERLICETTSRFEDFILQFLDRVFTFIDCSSLEFVRPENRAGDGKSKLETTAETVLEGVCSTLLLKTSNAIFLSALHKLRTFVTERILETKIAGQLVAVLCRIFVRVNGQDTLRALVPLLSQTILDIINEGEDVIKEENLDNRLLYAMLLLSAVAETPGHNLLPHINTFLKVLDQVLLLRSREGSKLACRILKNLLTSLSTVIFCQFRTVERDYNDPEYPYTRDWGEAIDIDSLRIKWYVPGKEEIATIQQIFSKYLPQEIEKLQKYCHDWNSLTREELLTSLNIVSSIVGGCESVLPLWKESPLPVVETSLEWIPFTPTLGITGEIVMPDGSNVRRYMTEILSNLQYVLLKNAEDDTKSLFVLVQIWNSLLLGKMRLYESYEGRRKSFQAAQCMLNDKLVGNKKRIGAVILERVDIQHEARLQVQSYVLTETHKNIMLELLALATSRYADVRSKAQCILFYGLRHFPYSYTFIVPRLMDILAKDTDEHHDAYKGVLYILFGPQHDPIMTKRDWNMLRSLWPRIVLSKPSEKLSVIRLKENLIETVKNNFPTYVITLEIPDRCLIAASKLWNTFPYPTLMQLNENEIQRGLQKLKEHSESNLVAYHGLLDDLLNAILEENLHWRHRLMSMNFIKSLVHPEQIYSPKIVRYFLEALIHDSLEERKIAIRTVIYMLKQQKRKHPKITIDIKEEREKELLFTDKFNVAIPGKRADNAWLQYDYDTRPLTSEQWNEPRFVHQPYIGYYIWPKKLEVYAPSSEQPSFDPKIRKLTDHEMEIERFFNDPQNVEKLIKFYSIEEKKDKDKFNVYKCLLFKSIFRNLGIIPLKHFLPHLRKLVTDKQESSQRCAAEITAGIIRGAKHWPFEMTCEMWNELLPIIRTALSNLAVETVVDWSTCFATALQRRDPNRHHWFLECLMEEPPLGESESSFVECGRLYALQRTLSQQSWRVSQLMQRLLIRLENRLLTNPFRNLRERLGSLLVTVFEADLRFPNSFANQATPRAQHFMDKIIPKLQLLAQDTIALISKEENSLASDMANVNFNDSIKNSKLDVNEREAAIRLLKIICRWIIGSVFRSQYGTLPGFYELFPIICQMENYETDEELTKICSETLAVLAQTVTLPSDMPIALDAIVKMSKHLSWWARATCLEFLQVLIFYNMSIVLSKDEWVNCIKEVVLNLLEDNRLEVREKAGHVLGGLLHCAFIPEQKALLEKFKLKAKTKLHKKCAIYNKTEAERNANLDAIRLRHAGVLGLCAFIRAHPYDIPNYLPPVFEHLGLHLNDPQPIPTTIRKTLGDFKRTHYDGWTGVNGHAQHFTEEQLAVLQDLSVPPSHYA